MTEYELNQLISPKKDMIKTKSKHRQSLETLIQGRKNELNSTFKKATIRLAFTVSEPSKERISIAGDLSPFGGSTDADGLSKVETMRVDGVEVDMETAVTKENIVDMYGVVIDGYFYNFEESGQHTIEYTLSDMVINEGICCTIGSFTYQGLPFTSKISNASVEINANKIEGFSFGYSPAIENVIISNNVTSIGKYAFGYCSGLISVTIGSGVTSIGQYAFRYCNNLITVMIGDSVTSIGRQAFYGNPNLTSITLKAITPPTLVYQSLDYTNDCPIYVPSASVETYKAASGWSTYASRIQAISTE